MARKITPAVQGETMNLTLRCTNVAVHPNNTQSVTLQEPARPFVPVRMPESTSAVAPGLRIPPPKPFPPPIARGPVSVLLTNISTEQKFEQGREYTVSIS